MGIPSLEIYTTSLFDIFTLSVCYAITRNSIIYSSIFQNLFSKALFA